MNRIRNPDANITTTERTAALATAREVILRLRGRPGAVYASVLRRSAEGELEIKLWGTRRSFWVGPSEVVRASVATGLTPARVAHIERKQRREEEATP